MLLLIFRATIEASKSNGLLLLFLKFIRTNSLVQFSFISRKKNLSGDTINFYSPPLSSTPPQQRKKKRKSIQGSRGRQRRQAGSLAANLRESLCLLEHTEGRSSPHCYPRAVMLHRGGKVVRAGFVARERDRSPDAFTVVYQPATN